MSNHSITLLISFFTIFIIVILFVQNFNLLKKLKMKTAQLTDTHVNLKEREEENKNLLINLHVGVAVFSPKGEMLLCNRKFLELSTSKNLKDKGAPLVEQSLIDQAFIKPPSKVSLEEIIENYINEDGHKLSIGEFPLVKVLSTGKPFHEQVVGIKDPDNGNVRWIIGDNEPEFDESGKLSKVVVTLSDITDRKIAEKALRESKNRLSAFLKVMPDMFFLLDRSGNLIDSYLENTIISPHIKARFSSGNIRDMEFIDEHTADIAFQNIEKLFETGEIQTFEFSSEKLGKDTFLEARFVLCGDDKVMSVVRDISERKKSEIELYNMSIHDIPTGLYNRNYFEHILDGYDNVDTLGMGIVICDLDGLKLVNDTLGHAEGDNYIKTVADVLLECFGQDAIVSRIGGDEFAVLIKHTTTNKLSDIALKIDKLLVIINSKDHCIPVSLSLGYAIVTDKQRDLRKLLKTADNLMYREKLHHKQSRKSENIGN